jgi:PhnB protein
MAVTLNPYLHFDGNAEEALHFYESVFGGEGTISRYGDNPMPDLKEEHKNLVMHADLQTGDIRLMLSDSGLMGVPTKGSNISMSLSGAADDEAKLTEYFNKLSAGGSVTVALEKAPWGDTFGMLDDKYGISWLVNIAAAS